MLSAETTSLNLPICQPDRIPEYLEKVGEFRLLNRHEVAELAMGIENDDPAALEALVRHHLRLPVLIIQEIKDSEASFSELINAGNRAMISAALKYNYRKGYKF